MPTVPLTDNAQRSSENVFHRPMYLFSNELRFVVFNLPERFADRGNQIVIKSVFRAEMQR